MTWIGWPTTATADPVSSRSNSSMTGLSLVAAGTAFALCHHANSPPPRQTSRVDHSALRRSVYLGGPVALAGCTGLQSTLDPAGRPQRRSRRCGGQCSPAPPCSSCSSWPSSPWRSAPGLGTTIVAGAVDRDWRLVPAGGRPDASRRLRVDHRRAALAASRRRTGADRGGRSPMELDVPLPGYGGIKPRAFYTCPRASRSISWSTSVDVIHAF